MNFDCTLINHRNVTQHNDQSASWYTAGMSTLSFILFWLRSKGCSNCTNRKYRSDRVGFDGKVGIHEQTNPNKPTAISMNKPLSLLDFQEETGKSSESVDLFMEILAFQSRFGVWKAKRTTVKPIASILWIFKIWLWSGWLRNLYSRVTNELFARKNLFFSVSNYCFRSIVDCLVCLCRPPLVPTILLTGSWSSGQTTTSRRLLRRIFGPLYLPVHSIMANTVTSLAHSVLSDSADSSSGYSSDPTGFSKEQGCVFMKSMRLLVSSELDHWVSNHFHFHIAFWVVS